MKRALLTLLAVCFFTASDDAQGALCGASITPSQNIASAFQSAPDGTFLCLRGGTYPQSPSLSNSGAWKGLRSTPGQVATILGRTRIPDGSDHVIVSDLRLDGGNQDLPSPQINGDDVWLLRNEITNRHNGICMSLSSSPNFGRAERILVRRNYIHDCGDLPQANHHHGIYSAAWGALIEFNLITDNADRGVQLYPSGRDQVVRQNIIWGNGQGGNFSGSTSNSTFERNVIGHSIGARGPDLAGGWLFYDWQTSSTSNNALRHNCLYPDNPDPRYNESGGVDSGNFQEEGNLIFTAPPITSDWHTTPECRALVGDPIQTIGRWPQGPPGL